MPLLVSLVFSKLIVGAVLGTPAALASYAIYKLSTTQPGPATASKISLQRAYLLANYATAVQLSNLRGEKTLMLVRLLIHIQIIQAYVALQALILWRSVSASIMVGGVLVVGLISYLWLNASVDKAFTSWNTAALYEEQSPPRRRAWGLLGHALLWGTFCVIFVVAILREYYL